MKIDSLNCSSVNLTDIVMLTQLIVNSLLMFKFGLVELESFSDTNAIYFENELLVFFWVLLLRKAHRRSLICSDRTISRMWEAKLNFLLNSFYKFSCFVSFDCLIIMSFSTDCLPKSFYRLASIKFQFLKSYPI